MPVDVKSRHHALGLDEMDDASSINTAFSVAGQFDLKPDAARVIAAQVGMPCQPGAKSRPRTA